MNAFYFIIGALLRIRCFFNWHDYTPTSAATMPACTLCGKSKKRKPK